MQDTNKFTLKQIICDSDYTQRRTKIVCTIGPSCWETDQLVKLLDYGMNVARLNFSHGDHKTHGQTIVKLREAFKQRKNLPCAIMLDTKGPEIRTGFFRDNLKTINLVAGQDLEICTDYSFKGDEKKIACSYVKLPQSVKVGQKILIADGTLVCTVEKIQDTSVFAKVMNSVTIGERKNMNLPGCKIDIPTVTEQDEDDIVKFGLSHGIDMIALSFTRTAQDIEQVRDIMGPKGQGVKIIAKIENQEGLQNYEEIVKVADGIMVARGDLGMEIPPQKVFVAQKWMINKARNYSIPVIVATQMLESMIQNPRPTRAEASDVANAVLDGCDSVMLSGETANGKFPMQAIEIMAQICVEAENCQNNEEFFWRTTKKQLSCKVNEVESMAIAAVQMSFELNSKIIVIFTQTGLMARLVSKLRPNAQIIVVSTDQGTIKGLCISYSVKTLRVPSFQGMSKLIEYAINSAKENKFCESGDKAIVITGSNDEDPDQGDILKIKTV